MDTWENSALEELNAVPKSQMLRDTLRPGVFPLPLNYEH